MEGPAQRNVTGNEITRRAFAIGGTVAVGAGIYKSLQKPGGEIDPVVVPEDVVVESVTEEAIEPYNELSDSGYFNHYCDLERERLERDAHIAVEQVDLVLLLQDHFVLSGIDNELLRKNLEMLVVGKVFAESRFDVNAKSEEGAIGFLQLMQKTIDEHLRSGEDITDLVTQIKVAVRLIEQKYRHLVSENRNDLALIRDNHFAGNEEDFTNYFLTPLLINAYNAGEGTLSQILSQYAEKYPTPESLVGIFEQSEFLTGYDVFIGMSHTAYNETWKKMYREDSVYYTTRVYAAYDVVKDAFKKAAGSEL